MANAEKTQNKLAQIRDAIYDDIQVLDLQLSTEMPGTDSTRAVAAAYVKSMGHVIDALYSISTFLRDNGEGTRDNPDPILND